MNSCNLIQSARGISRVPFQNMKNSPLSSNNEPSSFICVSRLDKMKLSTLSLRAHSNNHLQSSSYDLNRNLFPRLKYH